MLLQSRKVAALIVFAAFVITLIFLRLTTDRSLLQQKLTQVVGLGEYYDKNEGGKGGGGGAKKISMTITGPAGGVEKATLRSTKTKGTGADVIKATKTTMTITTPFSVPTAHAEDSTLPADYNFSRILVMPRLSTEDTSWVQEELPDLETAIYIVDDSNAPLHPPQNKGHEVMIYLTYIIDHYDSLPDIVMFMHAHRFAWHNNELFNFDAVEMIRRLSNHRVHRKGYMNLRCHWVPGCPSWMHPGTIDESYSRPEEPVVARAWSEIFPNDPIPLVLGQACCSQFALSRARIQSIPHARYRFFRDWLVRTELSDAISGRVWEYLWQYLWTGNNTDCPSQSSCYCDGYGLCFGGEDNFEEFYQLRAEKDRLEAQLAAWRLKADTIDTAKSEGSLDEGNQRIEVPEVEKDDTLTADIQNLERELDNRMEYAFIMGHDPKQRAQESEREWHEGDGF